jgi:hypothetical protein
VLSAFLYASGLYLYFRTMDAVSAAAPYGVGRELLSLLSSSDSNWCVGYSAQATRSARAAWL